MVVKRLCYMFFQMLFFCGICVRFIITNYPPTLLRSPPLIYLSVKKKASSQNYRCSPPQLIFNYEQKNETRFFFYLFFNCDKKTAKNKKSKLRRSPSIIKEKNSQAKQEGNSGDVEFEHFRKKTNNNNKTIC